MENLIGYLQYVKKSLQDLNSIENIHIVLGNESCDTDSSVSTIVLSYFLHTHKPLNIHKNTLIIPVQNASKEHFPFHTDTCYLYNEVGLPLDLLVYRDEINFETLVKTKNVTTSLVDHHVLTESQQVLNDTVLQIFDHRPHDLNASWDKEKVDVTIEQVGSCTTLIADQIISAADSLLFEEIGYLLYATIVVDCKALKPGNSKAKELDCKMAELLENKFNFTVTREKLFKKMMKLRSNVSNLTPKQILYKDTKIIEGVPVPSLPMLVENFLQLEGCQEDLKAFANESKALVIVLKGAEAGRKDVAVFCTNGGEKLKEKTLEVFFQNEEYNFEFTKLQSNFDAVTLLNQGDLRWSRKQLVPLIKIAVSNKIVE